MKRTLIAVSAVLALVPAGAHASTSEQLIVNGTIQFPSGASRAQRCARDLGQANGMFGWMLNVNAGKSFSLTTTAPAIDDVNIAFYKTITPCETNANIAGTYWNRPGNESGTVPTGATKAIIYTGSLPIPPEHASGARPYTPFTYTEG